MILLMDSFLLNRSTLSQRMSLSSLVPGLRTQPGNEASPSLRVRKSSLGRRLALVDWVQKILVPTCTSWWKNSFNYRDAIISWSAPPIELGYCDSVQVQLHDLTTNRYPNILALAEASPHPPSSVVDKHTCN